MDNSWIKTAVIGQIHPFGFNYAEGSKSDPYKGAYGNLKGITEKADYIKSLGYDAIWICPFYKWNRNGFGYDITDYEEISPMFGTKEDFAELVKTYHSKNIKVLIDVVANHCSKENVWFKKSENREEPYTDFFVWADAKGFTSDGKPIPPNNWESTWDSSGTSAWCWNPKRKQFYMHSFDYTMPNLNINNPAVRKKLLEIFKNWFDMGVDGFRLDGTCHFGYDPRLLDNPIVGPDTTPNLPKEEIEQELGKQMRIYDINHKLGIEFIDEIKELANSYPEPKVLLAEYVFDKGIYGNRKGIENIRNSACDTFYTGALRGGLEDFRAGVESMLKPQKINSQKKVTISEDGSKINWALSNHDMERVASRWFGNKATAQKTKMAMKMLLSLPGSVCIFQGEELGLSNPDIEKVKNPSNDPLGLCSIISMPWDVTRTSIPFSKRGTNMWLKPTLEQRALAVDIQERKKDSMLNATREAVKWRKNSEILNNLGYLDFIETGNDKVIAYIRSDKSRKNSMLLCFNFTDEPARVRVPVENGKFKTVIVPAEDMVQYDSLSTVNRLKSNQNSVFMTKNAKSFLER